MIITVQGTQDGRHSAAEITAALSCLGIAKHKKRTLILQFTDRTTKSAENYLIGRSLRNESLIQDVSLPDLSIGMDALCVHMSGSFSAEIFDECTRHLVNSNVKNLYDIAICSRKDTFEKELIVKEQKSKDGDEDSFLQSMLKTAGSVYDLVYCLVPGDNQAICDLILPLSDVNVMCVKQGRREPVNPGKGRNIIAVADYCPGSMFHDKAIAKEYQVKKVCRLTHNVSFNDACADGTVLSFMQKNMSNKPGDSNYYFSFYLNQLYSAITGKNTEEEDTEIRKFIYDGGTEEEPLAPVEEQILTVTEESGFFKKKEVKTMRLEVPAAEEDIVDEADAETDIHEDTVTADAEPETAETDHAVPGSLYDDVPVFGDDPYGSEETAVPEEPVEEKPKKRFSFFKKKDHAN